MVFHRAGTFQDSWASMVPGWGRRGRLLFPSLEVPASVANRGET